MIRHACGYAVLALGAVILPGAALVKDSSRVVCAGVATLAKAGTMTEGRMGLSFDFTDVRSGASDRKWTLSSIHQQKLFQGSLIDKSGDITAGGTFTLRDGPAHVFYSGLVKLQRAANGRYTMVLDARVNEEPADSRQIRPIKAQLNCVDLSI